MLEKHLYDSWKSRMELYMQNREHRRMILESVEHGPLIWPTIEENGVTRTKKYEELSATEKIQANCDLKATNIILQGLPSDIYSLVNHHRVAKDLWERIQLLLQELWYCRRFPVTQRSCTQNSSYQADDLDAYDSDCDEISTAKAVLMANLSSYGSNVLSEVPYSDNTNNDMLNQSVQEMPYYEQLHLVVYLENEITSDNNIIPYSQYLLETQNAVVQDTTSSAQQDAMILSVFEQLSHQVTNYQIISQDIMNIVVNSSMDMNTSVNMHLSVALNDSVNYVEMCNKCLKLEAEFIKQHNMVEKDEYNKLSKRFFELEQHCISLEIEMQLNKEIFQKKNTYVNQTEPTFDQLFELNNLKAELQAKDTKFEKLKANIKRLNKTSTTNSVKKDIDEIETINIKLEHRVTKLIAENEHLKQNYKRLYDSIKPPRIRVKEQTESLVNQVNQKSVEISNLNAQLQEKDFILEKLKSLIWTFVEEDSSDSYVQDCLSGFV
ncbi:hypothetical protein Tco_1320888 [Tanacetum coccineum]